MAWPRPKYSFVLPVFNEEETLPQLHDRLLPVLERLDGPWEVILVDDGSKDRSYECMTLIHQKDPRFRILSFSRNFGHQVAITAGMDHASGEATVIMDADLQDPPEVILQMVRKWKEGYEVVYAVREERQKESFAKKITARVFYRLLSRISEIEIPADVGDFRLVDRKAMDAFLKLRERNRYVRGMFSWIGFKQASVSYIRHGRYAGATKFSWKKMMKFAKDGIFSFSTAPLRLSLRLGFLSSGVAAVLGLWAAYLKLTHRFTVVGWTSLAVMIAFFGGAQLIVIGILGEYIARLHEEIKGRPLYLVREARGFNLAAFSPEHVPSPSPLTFSKYE